MFGMRRREFVSAARRRGGGVAAGGACAAAGNAGGRISRLWLARTEEFAWINRIPPGPIRSWLRRGSKRHV